MKNKNTAALSIKLPFFLLAINSLLISIDCNKANPVNSSNESPVTDIDGNVYQTVKIGNQVWMAENLRTTKYSDSTAIPHVAENAAWQSLTTPGYCYYNNMTDADSIEKFGALYNWYSLDTKNIAPPGWHVPADSEWDTLKNYLIANGNNWNGTTTEDKIAKALSAKTDWLASTNPGTVGNDLTKNNNCGFSALPGGYRYGNGLFYSFGAYGHWWSASQHDTSNAYYYYLYYDSDMLFNDLNSKSCGFSVRLLKDN